MSSTNKKEYKTIKIERFRTNEGNPTCRASPEKICIFLQSIGNKFGFECVCSYDEQTVNYNDSGYLQTTETCVSWSNKISI